jgi:acyl-homoserine-lactone acylase
MPRPTVLLSLALLGALAACTRATATPAATAVDERARLVARAQRVLIRRDDWGIPHITAPTDADAVFGMMYAQAEDDFMRVERNYLVTLGRLAEAEGESALASDVRARLWVHDDSLRARYRRSPAAMRALMDAWADGLNWYLATHPAVPRTITRFEPWMPLAFTEGSIGGDIEGVALEGIRRLYLVPRGTGHGGDRDLPPVATADEARSAVRHDSVPGGSNGFAVAPARTAAGHALLLHNPHTSHYFRSEARIRSDEGLDVYGASTWGQFFVYQGFNARLGWMHTSAYPDVVDEYRETIVDSAGTRWYRYAGALRPVRTERIVLKVRTAAGLATRTVDTYHTHHGPVTRADGEAWIATRLMDRPIEALQQSWGRTRARTLAEFKAVMALRANSSNATVYADADGHIAYFHPNFVPKRDVRFDWTRPVDGSDPATEWQGIHTFDEMPNTVDPRIGWIQNTNNWPYSAAGPSESPKPADFPSYMDRIGENPRGIHAMRVLDARRDFTLDRLRDAAYDSELTAFEPLVPALLRSYDALPSDDARRRTLAEPIAMLRAWDRRFGAASVATAVAIFWGDELFRRSARAAAAAGVTVYEHMATGAGDAERLAALQAAVDTLGARFGTWRTPWGEINRFQRIANTIDPVFDDAKPSLPVGFASARWGSLASFDARRGNRTKRLYGTYGNSFVAVVEFGPRVKAKAIMAGGQSGDPTSPHFADQVAGYASGTLRDVYVHEDELRGHVRETYRPGERRR